MRLLCLWLAAPRLGFRERGGPALRFAHTFTTESERQILDALVSEFQHTHPGLEVEQIISNSETYNTLAWRLQFRGQHPPDIYFQWQGYRVEKAIDEGWALELTPFLSRGFLEEFVPSTRPRQRGGVYFLPHSVDLSNLVWFNRAIFERLQAQAPGSLSEWINFCLRLRENRILALAQGNRDLWPMGNVAAEFLGKELGPEPLHRLFASGATIRVDDLRGLNPPPRAQNRRGFGFAGRPQPLGHRPVWRYRREGDVFEPEIRAAYRRLLVSSGYRRCGGKGRIEIPGRIFSSARRTEPPGGPDRGHDRVYGAPGDAPSQGSGRLSGIAPLGEIPKQVCRTRRAFRPTDAASFTRHPIALEMLGVLGRSPQIIPPPDTAYPPEQAAIFYELCGKLLLGELGLAQAAPYWSKENPSGPQTL